MEFKRMALVDEDVANSGQNNEDTLETINKLTGKNVPNRKRNQKKGFILQL